MARALCPGASYHEQTVLQSHTCTTSVPTQNNDMYGKEHGQGTSLSGASAAHREKYVPAARHYGATMPASYNILNMECSMPYRADLSQPYPSPTASKIFSPNPNQSMSQLFILLTHLHTFLKNSLPLLNSSINR